jgi:bacteriochlorophyllide a dehydrogenase
MSLGGLITHTSPASDAAAAYELAFTDPACLKMILDWSAAA